MAISEHPVSFGVATYSPHFAEDFGKVATNLHPQGRQGYFLGALVGTQGYFLGAT